MEYYLEHLHTLCWLLSSEFLCRSSMRCVSFLLCIWFEMHEHEQSNMNGIECQKKTNSTQSNVQWKNNIFNNEMLNPSHWTATAWDDVTLFRIHLPRHRGTVCFSVSFPKSWRNCNMLQYSHSHMYSNGFESTRRPQH